MLEQFYAFVDGATIIVTESIDNSSYNRVNLL